MRTYPCCEHCEPEADGNCWAARIGHGAYCLTCQTAKTPERSTDGAGT